MSDNQQVQSSGGGTDMGLVAYICYAASVIFGITAIVGVIIAYMQRGEAAGTWRESHYTWLIRTFWIWLLGAIIGIVLSVVLIGFLVLLLLFIWFIIRIVKGWMAYDKQQPIADPESWLFG